MRNASTDSPIDDLTYDVITVLHAKAKALEAYDQYISDAVDDDEAREVLEEMKRQDQENVRVLKEVLARRLDEELGYSEEEEEFAEEEDYDEAEEEEEEEVDVLVAEGEEDLEAGEHRGEEVAHVRRESPPRRGESTSRRGA